MEVQTILTGIIGAQFAINVYLMAKNFEYREDKFKGEGSIVKFDVPVKPKEKPTGRKKLSSEQVSEIRELYKTGEYSYEKLGKMFDVGKNTINKIIKFNTYKDVKPKSTSGAKIPDIPKKETKRRGAKPKISSADKAYMKSLRMEGKTQQQIADKFNVSLVTVWRVLNEKR